MGERYIMKYSRQVFRETCIVVKHLDEVFSTLFFINWITFASFYRSNNIRERMQSGLLVDLNEQRWTATKPPI